jgi:hypothetical protein
MTSTHREQEHNLVIKLGTKSGRGYEYASKIDFKGDFGHQIERIIKEKKAHDRITTEIPNIKRVVQRFENGSKEKNLKYYYEVGKILKFMDGKGLEDIAPYSVYRRIIEEVDNILPHLKTTKDKQKHLETMRRLAHVDKNTIIKLTWNQWYEILKFKDAYENKGLLRRLVKETLKKGISRERIKNLATPGKT